MNIVKKITALAMTVGSLVFAQHAMAQEAPDALVKRITEDVLTQAKADKEIQAGNQRHIQTLVEAKILPYVDFQHMTSLAAGPDWAKATPEQQKQLTDQFRSLLVHTYSGAISKIKDQKVTFRPMRADPASTNVEVQSDVIQPRNEPMQLNYRLEKSADGWKIYDINILGAWLVEIYKTTFASTISKSGVDGLIKLLSDKNKALASNAGKT